MAPEAEVSNNELRYNSLFYDAIYVHLECNDSGQSIDSIRWNVVARNCYGCWDFTGLTLILGIVLCFIDFYHMNGFIRE